MADKNKGRTSDDLRAMAYDVVIKNPPSETDLKVMGLEKLVHELQLHQIELEIQNEELNNVQRELAMSRDQYTKLYDFAPVGYLTLCRDNSIIKANITAMKMLGLKTGDIDTGRLVFPRYVAHEWQDNWIRFRRNLFTSREKQSCELKLKSTDTSSFIALLNFIAIDNELGEFDCCLVAIMDISERKRMEEELEMYRQSLESLVSLRTSEFENAKIQIEKDIIERKLIEENNIKIAEDLRQRNAQLKFFNSKLVERERRIIEMKKEVNELCIKVGEPIRYVKPPQ